MTADKIDFRIQGSFDDLQAMGRVLTCAIVRTERVGDKKQTEKLFMVKAKLVKTLGESLRV